MCDVKQPRHQAAMWFDGANDYINCGATAGNFGLSDLTITFYICNYHDTSTSTNKGVCSKIANPGWRLDSYRGILRFSLWTGAYTSIFNTIATIKTRAYCEIKILRSTAKGQIWVNGALGGEYSIAAINTVNFTNTAPLYIGSSPWAGVGNDYLNGVISDFKIWHGSTLAGYWRGNGNTAAAWQDRSGNGNHGTVYGSPEQCLIHRRGAVIRTDANHQRYIVT